MQSKKMIYSFINLMMGALLSFSLVHALTEALHFDRPWYYSLGLVTVVMLLCSLIFRSKWTRRISLGVISLGLAGATLYTLANHLLGTVFHEVKAYFFWLELYIKNETDRIMNYQNYTLVLLCLWIGLFVYLLAVRKLYFFLVMAGGMSLFVVQWIMGYFESPVAFYIFLILILSLYVKDIFIRHIRRETDEYLNPAAFAAYAVPFCAVVVLFALLLGFSNKPLEWKWLDDKIASVFNKYGNSKVHSFDRFSLASTGFGKSGKLGGKVNADNTPVLEVETPFHLYLRGAVSDTYTGSKWINSSKTLHPVENLNLKKNPILSNPLDMDIKEMYYSNDYLYEDPEKYSLENIEEYIDEFSRNIRTKVTFQNLKTKSIFIPSKIHQFDLKSFVADMPFYNDHGILSMGKTKSKSYMYIVNSYHLDYSNETLQKILRNSKTGLYQGILDEYERLLQTEKKDATDDEESSAVQEPSKLTAFEARYDIPFTQQLLDRLTQINQNYLQLPDTFPQRIRDLSNEIVSGKDNNYDKVKEIERFLSTNFWYTLTPPSTPRDRDFVDYFLFDLKKGYCTYYATAMTVMVRSLGIPARYVEGYTLPSQPSDLRTYTVTNQQAHAWVEVYFEGFGWVPFEPTSSFTDVFYTRNSGEGSINYLGDSWDDYYYYDEMMKKYAEAYSSIGSNSNTLPATTTNHSANNGFVILIVMGLLLLLLLLALLFTFTKRKVYFYRIMKLEPRASILAMYKKYMKCLQLMGLKIAPGETPALYAERIDSILYIRPVCFAEITGKFVIARYSTEELSTEDKKMVFDFYSALTEEARKYLGRLKYFLWRSLLGRI